MPLTAGLVTFGEMGLSGEVRSVSAAAQRIAEAEKLGFDTCVYPAACAQAMKNYQGKMKLIGVRTVRDAADAVL